jgi:hypothetical protein
MTETEARKFVSRWQLILLPIALRESVEARLVQQMEFSCKEGKVCSLFICCFAFFSAYAQRLTFWVIVGCVALALALMFAGLLWRIRQVCNALGYSQFSNRKS